MNKTNAIVAAIALALIVLAAGVYGFSQKTKSAVTAMPQPESISQPTTTPTPSAAPNAAAVEVDLTDQGFSPLTVTIKKGQTVHFVNKSSDQMWVASNPHPTHTDYPGFDELQTADTYDFTFDNIGTWGYHDHLNLSIKGEIVVTQ